MTNKLKKLAVEKKPKRRKFTAKFEIERAGCKIEITTSDEETANHYLHAWERTTLDAARKKHERKMMGGTVQMERLKDSINEIRAELNYLRAQKEEERKEFTGEKVPIKQDPLPGGVRKGDDAFVPDSEDPAAMAKAQQKQAEFKKKDKK